MPVLMQNVHVKIRALPYLSLNIPSGICVIMPPTANAGNKKDTSETDHPLRSAYTGKLLFNIASSTPYASGPSSAIHPNPTTCL